MIAPGGRPIHWCFVLLSVALGTQFLSSYPSTSALPTRGWFCGTPLNSDRIFQLVQAPQLVRAFHSRICMCMLLMRLMMIDDAWCTYRCDAMLGGYTHGLCPLSA